MGGGGGGGGERRVIWSLPRWEREEGEVMRAYSKEREGEGGVIKREGRGCILVKKKYKWYSSGGWKGGGAGRGGLERRSECGSGGWK